MPVRSNQSETRSVRAASGAAPWAAAACRAASLSLGLFALANLTIGLHRPGFDANIWWIDLRPLPAALSNLFLILGGVFLAVHGVSPRTSPRDRAILSVLVGLLGACAVLNAIRYAQLLATGTVHGAFPIPFSAVIALVCTVLILTQRYHAVPLRTRHRLAAAGFVVLLTSAFPVAQMWCFGKTDYRREGDVAVIFGAGVHADGTPSLALSDRVLTGCKLWRDGYVTHLLLSGGPGAGSVHEVDAMRRLAIEVGRVPESAIVLDPRGVDTRSTVRNANRIATQRGFERLLAVSHFYHLPRIKMAFQRAGREVYTVPAEETRVLTRLPWYIAREIAAFWYYYARPVVAML